MERRAAHAVARVVLRQLPSVDLLVVFFILEVEVVTADGLDVRIAHHVDHAHQLLAVGRAFSAVRRARVAEGEEVGLLVDERIAQDAARDRDQTIPLLANVDVRLPVAGFGWM